MSLFPAKSRFVSFFFNPEKDITVYELSLLLKHFGSIQIMRIDERDIEAAKIALGSAFRHMVEDGQGR